MAIYLQACIVPVAMAQHCCCCIETPDHIQAYERESKECRSSRYSKFSPAEALFKQRLAYDEDKSRPESDGGGRAPTLSPVCSLCRKNGNCSRSATSESQPSLMILEVFSGSSRIKPRIMILEISRI